MRLQGLHLRGGVAQLLHELGRVLAPHRGLQPHAQALAVHAQRQQRGACRLSGPLAVGQGDVGQATGGLADITLPDGERAGQTARTTLLPLCMNGQRLGVRLQPPVRGQHTAELMEQLGYTTAQVQALQAQGAVA